MRCKIEKIVHGGDGLARHEGLVVFVPFTLEGEIVDVEIVSRHKNFVRARLVTIIEASPHRVPPPCPYFGHCGGCQLQHMSYEEQLRIKEKQLKELFEPLLPIHSAPKTYGYRKRIKLRHENGQVGYTAIDNHSFVPIDRCLIYSDKLLKDIPPYKDEGPFIIDGLTFAMSPNAFCQNFPEQSLNLYHYIKSLFFVTDTITDLYCGVGITTLLAAPFARHVYGIELSKEAIRLAIQNGSSFKNVSFFAQKAEEASIKGQLVLLNPPRTGLSPEVIAKLNRSDAQTLIYTSCNPATLARDLKRLNFSLISCKPFDMFPQTAHVEIVALLQKRKGG